MEYRWDPDSKFARAALADTIFQIFDGVDAQALSTQGDTEHWEAKVLFSQPRFRERNSGMVGQKDCRRNSTDAWSGNADAFGPE